MAVTEKFGRTLTGAGGDRFYKITEAADDAAALVQLLAAAPSTVGTRARDDDNCEVEEVSDSLWMGIARYHTPSGGAPLDLDESQFSFDTSGGTKHILASKATSTSGAPTGATVPVTGGLIGITKDSVEGVDIVAPAFNFEITKVFAAASVTSAYKQILFGLTGTTNAATFEGFAIGTVLFLGAAGTTRADGDWEIIFRFAASPNATGIVVGDCSAVDKRGWEYLWVMYEDFEDATAKRITKKPIAVYVEQVYDSGDFTGLGL